MAFVPVNKQDHAKTRIRSHQDYGYATQIGVVPVIGDELAMVAAYYPVAFGRFTEGGPSVPVAVLGLSPQRNLFVGPNGRWRGGYIPAVLRRYPFLLVPAQEEGQFAVCVDNEAPLLSETEGEPLFAEDGSNSPYLDRLTDFLVRVQGQLQRLEMVGRLLEEHALLQPVAARIPEGQPRPDEALTGALRQIDEAKLAALDDAVFLRLRQEGALPVAYAQLTTTGQWERLAQLAGLAKGEGHGVAAPAAAPPQGDDWVLSFD